MLRKQVRKEGSKRRYPVTVAGQLLKHLGLQMYSGAVPAISELISNSYDAMARNVWVTIPTGRSIKSTDGITVKDDGHGMNYDDCRSLYLNIGRNRRSDSSGFTKKFNELEPRRVHGRKGIGKLAGFGIAEIIEIRTVKEKEISHFQLDFNKLTNSSRFADTEGTEADPLSEDGDPTDEKQGTTVKLSQLKIVRSIKEEEFRKSLARRLLVLDDNFTIHVNEKAVTRQEIPFQFRFPDSTRDWETATLKNEKKIKWWAGFCKEPISEEEQRGFVVYARGKLAQTPWFFDLSGGLYGQHGMQYLTGEVQADFIDETDDLIATDRGTIRWEDPLAAPLKEWGRDKVRELLKNWPEKRRRAKITTPKIARYLAQAKKLPRKEAKAFRAAVNSICSIPQLDKDEEGKDIADELVEFAYNAMTNRSFLDAIRELNAASSESIERFNEVLSEWDIIEAVNTAHLVKGRIEIIYTFEQMIDDKVREKPDMQNYLKRHPWLIDPKWTMLEHERELDTLIRKEFRIPSSGKAEGKQRVDFFCLADSQAAYVVEVKRPGYKVGRGEFDKLRDYVLFLHNQQKQSTENEYNRAVVKGILIAGGVREGEQEHLKEATSRGTFTFRTWSNLLMNAKELHKEFLKVVKARAPSDDPRMNELSPNDSANIRERKPKKRRRRVTE